MHTHQKKLELIASVQQQVSELLPAQGLTPDKFINSFMINASFDDLSQHSIDSLCSTVRSIWKLIKQTKTVDIRVYNPEQELHGWQAEHTVIELIHNDKPFVMDSIMIALNRLGIYSHLVMHAGNFIFADGNEDGDAKRVSKLIAFIAIDKQSDTDALKLATVLRNTLADVDLVVDDWPLMQDQIKASITDLQILATAHESNEATEAQAFLKWVLADNFTILGIRNYRFNQLNNNKLTGISDTGLGILKLNEKQTTVSDHLVFAKSLLNSKETLLVSKTNKLAYIHRAAYADYIGVKIFDKTGRVIGQRKIIGLFTSNAYSTLPKQIPLIRQKIDSIFAELPFKPDSYAGKIIRNILDNLPRDELFQANTTELRDLAQGIYYIQERRQIKIFARIDSYHKFVSCFVFVPRENYTTSLRQKIQAILEDEFATNDIQFFVQFSDSVLARIHFIIRAEGLQNRQFNLIELEKKVTSVAELWSDRLQKMLVKLHIGQAKQLFNCYQHAFPINYQEHQSIETCIADIALIEELSATNKLAVKLDGIHGSDDIFSFKIATKGTNILLSTAVSILENMGFQVVDENPYQINKANKEEVWLSEFTLKLLNKKQSIDIPAVSRNFTDCFKMVHAGLVENDRFNSLVVITGMHWREVVLLRALAKYLQQIRFTFSQIYIEDTCINYPVIVGALVKLFNCKFSPLEQTAKADLAKLVQQINKLCDQVANLDEDKILRKMLEVINYVVRTNFFQQHCLTLNGPPLSLKIASEHLSDLPLPKPMFEVFVYHMRVEGIHLRSSKIARGGIRWSDRKEDFRTEVLGLMKAQVVKNAVIVPSGAKGGFVTKKLHTGHKFTREEVLAEGVWCYTQFIKALLDITDNQQGSTIIPPADVRCYDDVDPYLVVAADKGTATFSDIANEIAASYNFWLGDAFASGGSAGYDHKKMGITAKGAWESVKRHFRSIGVDTQSDSFTMIGIGDMAGDVFGNGLLLTKKSKLVAAFNHLHIFIDPSPEAVVSYQERARLFSLPRSSWTDYNTDLISVGGGVFSRSDKSIQLSTEAANVLGATAGNFSPNELIKIILKAPVDLLWNGGIGTYVKASNEANIDADDRSNDNTRVNAKELNCRVVGEGGNLGFTQLGRIEFNLQGGLIYTDFIDNSAGVDCSDHEVNIKILLNELLAKGNISLEGRNQYLQEMTTEVSQLVLEHNYQQTKAIALLANQANLHVDLHISYIEHLEKQGKIDRTVEFLPSAEVLSERKQSNLGLSMPGLAILLAYEKINLQQQILDSSLPDDPYGKQVLRSFFPNLIQEKFTDLLGSHSLHREIIATKLANHVVNHMGFAFVYRLQQETNAATSMIVKAYLVAVEVMGIKQIYASIDKLDNLVSVDTQHALSTQLQRVLRRAVRWLVSKHHTFTVNELVNYYQDPATKAIASFNKCLVGYDLQQATKKYQHYLDQNIPDDLALFFAHARSLHATFDCAMATLEYGLAIVDVVHVYCLLADVLNLSWLKSRIIHLPLNNSWDALARECLRDDLDAQHQQLVIKILQADGATAKEKLAYWQKSNQEVLANWQNTLTSLEVEHDLSFAMLFVAVRELMIVA